MVFGVFSLSIKLLDNIRFYRFKICVIRRIFVISGFLIRCLYIVFLGFWGKNLDF